MTKKKQKVAMPASIRNKLMAATSMLLVASIMMVSSTYAWFTLSTAPEVTGITTSVGANGNLEIALLTTDTFASPDTAIASDVGNSSFAQAVTLANITWGNLIDLSDPSYGLTQINLLPAAANLTTTGEGNAAIESLVTGSMLKTPQYGADGRVSELKANTISAIYSGTAFTMGEEQSYGVRAVGENSSMTALQISFAMAKSGFSSARNTASSALSNAITANSNTLLAVAVTGSAPETYSAAQVAGMLAIARGAQSSLNNIVLAYGNAGVAAAAAAADTAEKEQAVSVLAAGLTSSAAEMKSKLNTAGVTSYDSVLGTLATAQNTIAEAIGVLDTYDETGTSPATDENTSTADVTAAIESLYTTTSYTDNDGNAIVGGSSAVLESGGRAYISGGVIGTIADQVGGQRLISALGVDLYSGAAQNQGNALNTVAGVLAGLSSPAGSSTGNISDTYGYVIDFAFRTNAASSYLKLQTEGVNRVYSDQTDEGLATQGGGATVSYQYNDLMTSEQALTHLGSVRFVFFDPIEGKVLAKARLDTTTGQDAPAKVDESTKTVTAPLKLYDNFELENGIEMLVHGKDYYTATTGENDETIYVAKNSITINGVQYSMTEETRAEQGQLTQEQYDALPAYSNLAKEPFRSATDGTEAKIVDLDQNVAKRVSVLVYLDGQAVRNKDVANAATSGTLSLNLQFSSSAELLPMQNTALRTMTATTQETTGGNTTNESEAQGGGGN